MTEGHIGCGLGGGASVQVIEKLLRIICREQHGTPITLPASTGWKTITCRNESVYSKADQQLNLGATPCSVLAFRVGLFFNQGRNRKPGN